MIRLKLDENLSRHLQAALSALQFDTSTVAAEGLLGVGDEKVCEAAARENRILLTLDVEFGDLRKYPPGAHPGIVLFRPASFGPLSVNTFVKGFLRETDLDPLRGCVVVVEPSRIRVRRPPLEADRPS